MAEVLLLFVKEIPFVRVTGFSRAAWQYWNFNLVCFTAKLFFNDMAVDIRISKNALLTGFFIYIENGLNNFCT
jgi:hypothetical protein